MEYLEDENERSRRGDGEEERDVEDDKEGEN